jgi:intracellular sulfur oxidation DsrE/DsrF family protein
VLHAEEEIVKKVVYDLTTGDIKRFEKRFISGIVSHKIYYQNKLEELDIIVIIHGNAYKFFMKNLKGTPYVKEKKLVAQHLLLGKRLFSLAKQYDVKFLVCKIGTIERKLDRKSFYPFVSFVHSAPIGLIDAQNKGYAYMPLH